ncbi:hypothetical protein EG68_00984 [Paragonimus skrjabini miyazakii]|uniref:Uncharacterized protein n=1 Tax=Paragonimus skrjabini miyazakii TaxID=59628 RepID=A0A8S9Z8J6_9TREM|nr:hypothetical protein EG68_00984 [Paragonimus skrjabini miyazakii]
MARTSGPKKSEDSEGPSFFDKFFTSIIDLLSSVIKGGHIKIQSTPTPPAPKKFRVGDNFRRWEFQAKEYVFLCTQVGRFRVLATLLDGEALDIAINEGILQGDVTDGTFRRLRVCFTTDPHRPEVCRQFHGRTQHPEEKLAAFIRELRRLCAEGFTDDTPEVQEQSILQQALEGTTDPSTRRALPTAAPTSIQKALDRAGTIKQVNGVLERDQQYRTREIAPVQYRPLARPQPFNRQERYGTQRMQRPPYQKPHCYYCSLHGKPAYRCGHNRAYRATVHASTGQTPHFMASGRKLRLASDTLLPTDQHEPLLTTEHIHQMHSSLVRGHQLAISHLQAAQRHQKAYFDRRVHGTQYQPWDEVWLYDAVPPPGIPSKLHKQWKSP